MPRIKHINPSDPGIKDIAQRFNAVHKEKSLLKILKLAWDKDQDALTFLEEDHILFSGAKQIEPGESPTSLIDYIHTVALAQRRFKWDGDELLQLKRLIKKNYPQSRQLDIQKSFSEVAYYFGEKDEESEKNFLNYLIEKFIGISLEKKEIFESVLELGDEDRAINLGEIDTEVSSGENGFFITSFDTIDEICNLLLEATTTPWQINN